jgi:CheY-like chemotaxis protein
VLIVRHLDAARSWTYLYNIVGSVEDPPGVDNPTVDDTTAAAIASEPDSGFSPLRAEAALILLIEDDFVLRTALAELLRSEGYKIECAANGLEGLNRLKEAPKPSLIVLDLMLPYMDGREFRSLQQAAPAVASIPLVVITASALSAADEALLNPARVFFKPLDVHGFLATVRQLCPSVVS